MTAALILAAWVVRAAFIPAWVVRAAFVPVGVGAQKPERTGKVPPPGVDASLRVGWQLLFHEGCRFAVPASWQTDADRSLATAPDGSNISVRVFRIADWSAHRAHMRAAFGPVNVVHEDSERRLWLEIGNPQRIQHYVDVPNGLSVCSALLEIRTATTPGAEDTTRRIVESLGAAPPGQRPPDSVR